MHMLTVTQGRYSRFWGYCSHIFELKYTEACHREFVCVLEQFKKKCPFQENKDVTVYRIISLTDLSIETLDESIFDILYEIYYDLD